MPQLQISSSILPQVRDQCGVSHMKTEWQTEQLKKQKEKKKQLAETLRLDQLWHWKVPVQNCRLMCQLNLSEPQNEQLV